MVADEVERSRLTDRLRDQAFAGSASVARRKLSISRKIRSSIGFAVSVYLCVIAASQAQPIGNPRQGLRIARAQCAECHRVANEKTSSRNTTAPTFKRIANVPGMTAVALTVALRTAHRTMPNIIVKNTELVDLVAYVLSLKETGMPNGRRR